MTFFLLSALALPAAAAALLMAFRGALVGRTARWLALLATLATLLLTAALAGEFRGLPPAAPAADSAGLRPIQPRFEIHNTWLRFEADGPLHPAIELDLSLGLDGVSLTLIVLTALLTVSCVLISWESIRDREPEFYAALLILESALIGAFSAFDVVLFYVFFEFTLIPLFFLIGIWGGPQRRYAAIKFFLFTFTGSLVTLVGLVSLVLYAAAGGLAHPASMPELAAWLVANPPSVELQIAFFLALSVGFMVKVPVFPLHTWLPLAHTEAPTAGSVLLAGLLLKLGTYGFLRLALPLFPDACQLVGLPLIGILGVIGILYGSLTALAQRDIKKLVAYSSVAHLGFCLLGLFALNIQGLSGAVLQMINHGLSTGALFLLVGMIYDRYHTRHLDEIRGLAARLPLVAATMVFISMASIGLPGLNGFVSEFLSLVGMFKQHPVYAAVGTAGVVLGAWYLLGMVQQALFGQLREPHGTERITDMNAREFLSVVPICIACLAIGVRPQPLLELIRPDIEAVAALYDNAAPQTAATAARNHPGYVVAADSRTSRLEPTLRPPSPAAAEQAPPDFSELRLFHVPTLLTKASEPSVTDRPRELRD